MSRAQRARNQWKKARPFYIMFDDAYLSVSAKPWRTLAMVAGVVLETASITATVLIAETQQVRIDRQFDAQRSGHVVLAAENANAEPFTDKATAQVQSLDEVEAAGQFSIWNEAVLFSNNTFTDVESGPLLGVTSSALEASETTSIGGLPLSMLDIVADKPMVWIGEKSYERLGFTFTGSNVINVAGRSVAVAGVLKGGDGFGYLDSSIIANTTTAFELAGRDQSPRFLAKVRPGSSEAVADHALAVLDPTRQNGLNDVTQADGEILRGNVSRDLRRIGLGLGAFSGLIGVVAIGNTLMMAVHQRSRELGLRGAIGWTRLRIGTLILLESALAGLLASIVGCGFGSCGAFIWAWTQGWALITPPTLPLLVIVAGTVSSIVGGIIPAYKAASISPLDAMRS